MMHPIVELFRQWRYLFLLISLLVLLVIHPVASHFGIMESLFDAFFIFVMLTLALTMAHDKVWRVVACILYIPAAMLLIAGHFLTSSAQAVSLTAGHAIGALFFVAVAGKIVRSIFASKTISWDSLFGAISGYVLLGVACALAYSMIHAADPESFHFGDYANRQMVQEDFSRNIFIYYSFVTLTTVGYGDVTPLSIPARTLSWVEALTGQLYLAVLIAGLISALVAGPSAAIRREGDH